MLPEIEFRYSSIYDRRYRESPLMKRFLKKEKKKYPSEDSIKKYIKEIEKNWGKQGSKILKEMSKISGFKWKEKKIICYVIGAGRAFSDPLTINILRHKNKNDFIDTLTHELIHQIQIQNANWNKWRDYLLKKYKKESRTTRSHISVHAIHWKLILNLFDEKKLKREIKKTIHPDYKKSWKIVEEEGYENIIKEFKKRAK